MRCCLVGRWSGWQWKTVATAAPERAGTAACYAAPPAPTQQHGLAAGLGAGGPGSRGGFS